jgi:hypothetical protein
MDWQSIGVFSVPLVIIPFPDCHHPFLCPSASRHQPQHRHCAMGSNHPFHSHSRPRGHGLHYLGLFKATCSTRQEAYDSRIIEVAKWGNFVSAFDNGNIVVIPGCGSEACKGGIDENSRQVYLEPLGMIRLPPSFSLLLSSTEQIIHGTYTCMY